MANKITTLFQAETKNFQSSMKNLVNDVKGADGFMGKLKTGVTGLGGVLKENAGAAALAAGTALVAFGKQSVDAFNDAALAAGKFSDTTGIAVDDASKWIAVADDYGISADSIQGSMIKMSAELGKSEDAFRQYGIEVAHAEDGTVDANQTFINTATTIGKIKDPIERTTAAKKLMGKSFSEVSRLMEMDAASLKAALDSTSEAQIIDPAELEKARDYQRAMDDLGDVIVDLKMQVGEALVPALTDAADALKSISDFADFATGGGGLAKLYDWANEIFNPLTRLKDIAEGLGITGSDLEGKISDTAFAVKDLEDAADDASPAVQQLSKDARDDAAALAEVEQNAREFDAALQDLLGTLDTQDAFANFQTKLYEYRALGTEPSEQATRDFIRELGNMVAGLEGVPEETKTRLLTELADGDIKTVEDYLWKWGQGVTVPVRFAGQGAVGFMKQATGGRNTAGRPVITGDGGREEVFVPDGPGRMYPSRGAAERAGVGGGGDTYNITLSSPAIYGVDDLDRRLAGWTQQLITQLKAGRR